MIRIPELPCPAVRDATESAAAWRTPVRREYWLPHDEHLDLAVGLPRQQIFGCGGPPQASWSSWGQEENQSWNIGSGIEGLREFDKVCLREDHNWRLARRRSAGSPQVNSRQQQKNCRSANDDERLLFHFANRSAMNAAISCGNRIIPSTTTTETHNKTCPILRPRMEHCLARLCCQNPSTMSPTASPNSQGRRTVKKALAAPAPRAAAKPSGRQQLIVATELKIAATDAEIPVPCFTAVPPRAPLQSHDESIRLGAIQSGLTPDTSGNLLHIPSIERTLPQRPGH